MKLICQEDVAIRDGIQEILQDSIVLQTFGVKGKHGCQDKVVILGDGNATGWEMFQQI